MYNIILFLKRWVGFESDTIHFRQIAYYFLYIVVVEAGEEVAVVGGGQSYNNLFRFYVEIAWELNT